MSKNYWEVETPVEIKGEKSVAKIYTENGKIQAFPVVRNSRYGIGKGATIDLQTMELSELQELQKQINIAIDKQIELAMKA